MTMNRKSKIFAQLSIAGTASAAVLVTLNLPGQYLDGTPSRGGALGEVADLIKD